MKFENINAVVADIPFKDLFVSDLNPRTVVNDNDILALADNIKALGLIQNLAGLRRPDGLVGIVAGGRRYRALATLQDDPRFQSIPVRVTDDPEVARYWASSENHLRSQPHPADEISEYGKMQAEGVDPANIAMAFGVTEAHVTRRLKLAHLPADVLAALRGNEITLGNAAAFTITDDSKLALEVLARVRGQSYSDRQIKQMLKPDAIQSSDRRIIFIGHDAYVGAGGKISTDLFADVVYYEDVDLVDRLFGEALQDAADKCIAKGWKWAEAATDSYIGYWELDQKNYARVYRDEGELTEEQSERYDELAELAEAEVIDEAGQAELDAFDTILKGDFSETARTVAGMLVYVNSTGELQVCDGLIRPEDKALAVEAGVIANHKAVAPTTKPDISAALRTDLNKVVLGAQQSAAIDDPDLLLAMLAYQLSHSVYWDKALDVSAEFPSITPTTDADGYAPDARLTAIERKDMYGKDLAKSFRAFRAKGEDHIKTVLAHCLAANLRDSTSGLIDVVRKETKPDVRSVWTPTAGNFFGRVKGPYLNALWQDLLGLADDHPTLTTFNKLKKKEKDAKLDALFNDASAREAMKLSDDQLQRIDAWLPEGMA